MGRGGGVSALMDAKTVIARLEEAGRTLLAIPAASRLEKIRVSARFVGLRSSLEDVGYSSAKMKRHVDASSIDRMDETLAWLLLIPDDRYVLRRIVGVRLLVSPLTQKHLYPWRRLAAIMGADHVAVQRWHCQGIDLIVAGLALSTKQVAA
jgi:hypothetical protein